MNKETGIQKKTEAGLPSNIFEKDAGVGLGKLGQEDLALPFLKSLDNYLQRQTKEMVNMSKVQSLE